MFCGRLYTVPVICNRGIDDAGPNDRRAAARGRDAPVPRWAQGKVVVYTSNDSNLNRFIFEAFKKETGVEVEQVEAGSGVDPAPHGRPSASARSATSSGA